MRFVRALRRLFARRHVGPAPRERSHEEMEAVRRQQRDIRARAEALGVRVDVWTRR
jgi:hypothetical protein